MCDYVLCLSGTAISSRPVEFFNTLNLLSPDQFPNEWKYLQVLAIDIPTLSVQPCVQLGYATRFLINSFIFPGGLLGIVWVTWASSERKQSNSDTEGQTTKLDGDKLAKRSDL